jgi:hypothetical protein
MFLMPASHEASPGKKCRRIRQLHRRSHAINYRVTEISITLPFNRSIAASFASELSARDTLSEFCREETAPE